MGSEKSNVALLREILADLGYDEDDFEVAVKCRYGLGGAGASTIEHVVSAVEKKAAEAGESFESVVRKFVAELKKPKLC